MMTMCDLSKAFDCVNHDLLVKKLEFYGVRGPALSLLESYLTSRSQSVNVNGVASGFMSVRHGVPQGSVLGPLLFIVYVNDLFYYLTPNSLIMYADDATLLRSHNDINQLRLVIDETEMRAEAWFDANKLKLNHDKTQRITFSTVSGIREGSSVTLLGIDLDGRLNWSDHVDRLCGRISSHVFLLRQMKRFSSENTLLTLYYALIHSRLSYGVVLWGNCSTAIRLFRLQKMSIRIIAGAASREHCKPFFLKYGIMTLPCLYIYHSILYIHRNKLNYQLHSDAGPRHT